MTASHDPRSSRRIFRVDSRNGKTWLRIDTWRTPNGRLVDALRDASRDCLWIVPNVVTVSRLLEAAQELLQEKVRPKHHFGSLLVLEATRPSAVPVLNSFFGPVVGASPSFKHLPYDELMEALDTPDAAAKDLIIGGWANLENELLVLVRGSLQTLVAPFSMFEATELARPDFRKLSFEDFGQTVRLGKYGASSDSLLYELDVDYRRRLNARRRESERGFGPALRRLRKQRGLSRSDFPGLTEKTLARIERGEIGKPHQRTVRVLEQTLGMTVEEVATY